MSKSQEERTWKDIKLSFLKGKYQKHADKWQNIKSDDRGVFCNIYNMIIKAIESLPDEPDNYVAVAMNHEINHDRETMDEILAYFTGKAPRKYGYYKGDEAS